MAAKDGGRERTIDDAGNDAEAARLRAQGLGYRQIAERQDCTLSTAHTRVKRAIAAVPVEAVTELRAIECARLEQELVRLNEQDEIAREVLRRTHLVVSDGRVVKVDDEPLEDSKPVLDVLNVLRANGESRRKISESLRKLLGLDAPVRQEVTVTDATDAAIQQLAAELAILAEGAETAAASTPAG